MQNFLNNKKIYINKISKFLKEDKKIITVTSFYFIELILRFLILFLSARNLELYGEFILLFSISSIASTLLNFGRLDYILSFTKDKEYLNNILIQNFLIGFLYTFILKKFIDLDYLIIFISYLQSIFQCWAFSAKGISSFISRVCKLSYYILIIIKICSENMIFDIVSSIVLVLLILLVIISLKENGFPKLKNNKQFIGIKFYWSSLLVNISANIEKIIPSLVLTSLHYGTLQQIREICTISTALLIPLINEHIISRPKLSRRILFTLLVIGVIISAPLTLIMSLFVEISKENINLFLFYFFITIISIMVTTKSMWTLIVIAKRQFKLNYLFKIINIILIIILFPFGNFVSNTFSFNQLITNLSIYLIILIPYIVSTVIIFINPKKYLKPLT